MQENGWCFFILKPMSNLLNKIKDYLHEVKVEVKKVEWPTRQETLKYTAIVVGISLFVAVFLGGLDFIFTNLLKRFVI